MIIGSAVAKDIGAGGLEFDSVVGDFGHSVACTTATFRGSCVAQALSRGGGLRFPGRSNRHSVANGSPPLRRLFGAVLPRR